METEDEPPAAVPPPEKRKKEESEDDIDVKFGVSTLFLMEDTN